VLVDFASHGRFVYRKSMTDKDRPGGDDPADDQTKHMESLVTQKSEREKPYLIVISGSQVGAMVKLKEGMTIGRGRQADFQTVDEGISRLHCRLRQTPVGVVIEDLDSRNGTFVNDEKIGTIILKDGDKIRIGTTTILKFSYADELEESFQRQMYDAALRDALTRIYNRRHFDEQLRAEFSYARRHGFPLSLIMMDIDHFKSVNDNHGHPVGDVVLIGLAQAVTQAIRHEDLFARYGGEEFVVLCRGTKGSVAYTIANRIRERVEQTALVSDVPELRVTVSAGVACGPTAEIGTPDLLVEAADRSLYRAKQLGRNRACLDDPDMTLGQEAETKPPEK
jgi:diguanylate cyclase (GGDEF)-like protein